MDSIAFLDAIKTAELPLPEDAGTPDLPHLDDDHPMAAVFRAFCENEQGRHFLSFMYAHSGFLWSLIRRDTGFFAEIAADGPKAAVQATLDGLHDLTDRESGDASIMKALRVAKRKIALAVAVADILNLWPLEDVTGALADMAEAALEQAVRHALRAWRGDTATDGFVVLGMGKFGSRELNYSSDIDLIVLYDTERLAPEDPDRLRQDLVRVTRNVMRLMDERTGDGYVFRTDLRLRPDPGATPLAISVLAAETYYESLGQNWERAAMIKARPVAGDKELGDAFLTHIRPFIWRKYLDFAAIQDIHSIKRQINAHRGGATIAIDGHNIKIGRGGIREIEFFAQTQQLIWGGRQPEMRVKPTCLALEQLAANGHTEPDTVRDLTLSYGFLRRLEHRLQMVADQQTQTLPEAGPEFDAVARFMGFADPDQFRTRLRTVLETVAGHYARLFEEAPDLGGDGSLVFTGADDDPDTLETLTRMGFRDASHIAGRIRIWHTGRYRATRSTRSRQILTEIKPRLLQAFANTSDPDEAFQQFDNFLSGLPSGVQLFSLFQAYPVLLDLVSEILGSAPRLAEWLSRKPVLLDSVLSEDFFEPVTAETVSPDKDGELYTAIGLSQDYQDILDAVRRWTNDRKFRIGVHLLRGIADGDRVGPAYTALAEAGLEAVLPATQAEFREAHGDVPGSSLAVVAFGKLGGGELLPMSDLDLVFVYDTAPDVPESDGARPIGPQVYYLRLCQRFVTAITTETGEGGLYEVDTRLRPAGKAGALATQFSGFESYYRLPDGEAWTWEHMALTRARPVYGDPDLRARLSKCIRAALVQERDPDKLFADVDHMRDRIEREFAPKSAWDIKYRRGGLVDVEFIAQTLQLAHASENPGILSPNTGEALERLEKHGYLNGETARDLREALALWRRLQAVIRLTAPNGGFNAETAPEDQKRALARAAGLTDFSELAMPIEDAATAVHGHYRDLIGSRAEAGRAALKKKEGDGAS